jgi:tetratricopeptide (TPR) repeat protein
MNRKKCFLIRLALIIVILLLAGLISSCKSQVSMVSQGGGVSLEMAEKLADEGKYEEALGMYSQLIKSGKSLDLAYYGRASLFMSLRRFDEAIQDYTKSLEINQLASTYASRCTAYRILTLYEEANQDCQKSYQMDPGNMDAMLALSFLYLEQGKNDKARPLIDELVKKYSEEPMAYLAVSRLEMVEGAPEKAIDALTRAIELDPSEPQYYWERGFLFYSNGMIDESEADMKKLLEVAVPGRDSELMMMAGNLMNTYSGSRTPQP